jgi:ATP-dependent DNA helicase DinG
MPPPTPPPSGQRELKEAVLDAFAEDGALARALPEFEPRPGQRAMAGAVADTIAGGGVLLAEAGTGTGKTLAYLIPALLSGHRVLVSTGTKNLQEQILGKDLPLLERALPVRFTATCMKGRANYLCLHRFEAFRESAHGAPASPPAARAGRPGPRRSSPARRSAAAPTPSRGHLSTPPDAVHLTLIEEWATTTTTGDRAEIDELPEDLPFWGEIAATTENCLGSQCPRYTDCFVTRMRQRAAESDIVIVNHHLLCADAALRHHSFGEVIPDCPLAVIDEAHQLEDVATQYFGRTVSSYRLEELVRDGDRLLGARAVAASREQIAGVRDALRLVEQHARALVAVLLWRRPGAGQRSAGGAGLFDERQRLTPDVLEVVAEAGLRLTNALDGLQASIALVEDAAEDLRAIGRRAGELAGDLRFVVRAGDEDYVYFLEIRGRGVFLRATPIDVSSVVRDLLIERHRATVLTSATLAVGGSFSYVRSRLGIAAARDIQLPPEFDYRRQAILYLPRRFPDPRSPEFGQRAAEETVAILRRTEGRAFVLFTSYATLREVASHVASNVPYPLLIQGEAPRSILLERFKTTPHSVLLATSSFWQGVDVVGDALSCVIIDKLPFASPADPIVQARIEAIEKAGGDAFAAFQVPLAILTLLQGLGRLLRHRTDRGVLAVLDPRLRTMGYGRRFLSALPPAPVTHEIEDIARFLGTA